MSTCSVIGCPNSGERNPNVFYVTMSTNNRSHVTWLEQNVKHNIITIDDTITICQLHLDFGGAMPSQPAQPSQPVEQQRSTASKCVQHTTKQYDNQNKVTTNRVKEPLTRNSKLHKILSEPSTSKAYRQNDEQAVKDIEQYNSNSHIEREVIDIESAVGVHVVKRRRISQNTCNAQEVQVISDDDDSVEENKTQIYLEEVVDDPMSGDEKIDYRIDNHGAIVIDDGSVLRTDISINPHSEDETSIKEEPEEVHEEKFILVEDNTATNLKDPLKIENVKVEINNEISELGDGEAEFEDTDHELTHIKEESPDNTIDIGETVIQAAPVVDVVLDNIFCTLLKKKLITVADRNYLSTLAFDANCLYDKEYKCNDIIKEFAQQLYLCSEEAYTLMGNKYMPCLPTIREIKETFITSNGAYGFSKEALDCLKMKVNLMKDSTKYVFCSLAINDIELDAPETREKYRVAFIVTAVALTASWKLPICYFITPTFMNPKTREQMVILAISLVEKCGVLPKAVSYLPIFQNIEMAERIVKDKKIKNKNTFFSRSGKAIYLIPDPAYIFDKFKICGCEDSNGMLISFRHIELLVKQLNKIRPGKMTNRLLGKSISYSLEVCADDFLSSGLANVRGTVTYLKLINRFLDVMTSHPGGTSWKKAVRGVNMKTILKFLETFQEYLTNILPKYKSNPFWLHNTSQGQLKFDARSVMDLVGMAVRGAIALIRELIGVLGRIVNELSMKKLTMNTTAFLVSNFYHVVDNGELRKMTIVEFTARYKQNLQFMTPHASKTDNNVPVENISVLDATSPVQRINITTYLPNSNYVIQSKQYEIDINDDLYKILKYDPRCEFSHLSKIYIAGYVAYNLVRRLRCDPCISALLRLKPRQNDDPYNTELVLKKTEQDSSSKLCVKLMGPSVDVIKICKSTDVVITRAMMPSNADELDKLKRFSIPLLMLKIKEDMIGRNYFKSLDFHRHDTDMLENHVVELAMAVAEVYLQIRLKYRTC